MDAILSLWPPHGLDQTIHLAILLGVLTLLFFTEAYGWVFNGLVVPGYLASVFVIQPAAGVAVVFESLLTFGIARLVSDVLARSGAWSRFFGRERFFLIILVSVIVRQQSQLWLLPDVLALVDDRFGTTFHLERSFSSIGLVLVPLTANMFWKLDVRRGLTQVAVPTLIVYALLRFVFLRYTNLSLSSLELTYENVALDFLASPKAYILLLTGAYLASRYNLLYGWDFSGVLVPALLALACFSPWRLVTTTVEALALVVLVSGLLKIPWMRAQNVEGPRKIALVFTVSFLLKFLVGWALAPQTPWGAALLQRLPEFSVTDLYGFGYLVPSLLATKMLSRGARARVLVPTLQVAALTFVLGSLIGFTLDQLAPAPLRVTAPELRPPVATAALLRSPQGVMAIAQVRARLDVASDAPLRRPYQELAGYARLWRQIDRWLGAPTDAETAAIAREARLLGLSLTALPTGGYALIEAEERLVRQVGWDSAVLYPGAPGPVLEVPRPWSEAPAAPAAALLCAALRCRAVIASGVDTAAAGLPSGDALVAAWAPLAVAHGQLRSAPVIQVRADDTLGAGEAVLHVRDIVPPVQLASLWPAPITLSWAAPPEPNRQWDVGGKVAVLRTHPGDLWRLVAARAPLPPAPEPGISLAEWLAHWLGEDDADSRALARLGTYSAPSETELRFLEEIVARELFRRAATADAGGLRAVHAMAALVGHAVRRIPDCAGPGVGCWILAENPPPGSPHRLGWGALVVREGVGAAPIALEVPRPQREVGTWRLGVELWRTLGASVYAVAGIEPGPGGDRGDPDPAALWNLRTPMQAYHQAIHGALGWEITPVILQIRGYGFDQPVTSDLVVALARATGTPPPRLAEATDHGPLAWTAGRTRTADGSLALLELAGAGSPQLHYSSQVGGVPFAMLWFSEEVRARFRGRDAAREGRRFALLGLDASPRAAAPALAGAGRPVRPPGRARRALRRPREPARPAPAARRGGTAAARRLLPRAAGRLAPARGGRRPRDPPRPDPRRGRPRPADRAPRRHPPPRGPDPRRAGRAPGRRHPARDEAMRRALPVFVLILVVGAAAAAARVVLDVLERPPDTLDRKLEGADRFLYYVVTEREGPRFELTGSEATVHVVSHAVLDGRAPYDPERQAVYGLRFRVTQAGEVSWSRDVWIRSRQSKAGWDGRAWVEESAFSLDPRVQVTDDRAASIRLPDDVPPGAMLDVRLISSSAPPAQALVRVYQQIERPRAQAAQTLRSLSPAERAALADRISYVPWDRLSPEEQAARLRFRDQRMSAAGRDGVDYRTRALWVTKLRLPPPTGLGGSDDQASAPRLGTGEAVAWNVLGPAELTLWVVRPIAEPSDGLTIEPLGGVEITAVGEGPRPPAIAITTPRPGDVVERKLTLPEGLHSLQVLNRGAPVRVVCVPAAGSSVQFGAEAAAMPTGSSAPLRPEVTVLSGYVLDASAKADLLLEGPGDFLTRVVRIDARQLGDLTGQLGPPARIRVTALDAEGRVLARDEALLAPVRAPFERLVVRRAPGATPAAPSPPVAEPLGFRFLAPVTTARVIVESDRLVFVRPYTLAATPGAGDLVAEPYRHVPLERTTWRYAPYEERSWVPLEAENELALAAAGREARIEGQIRLEDVPPPAAGGPASSTVDPEGTAPRRLVMEPTRRGEGKEGIWTALGTERPLTFRLAQDGAPRVSVWVLGAPAPHLGQRLTFTVDGKPAGEHVVRSARGQVELPRLTAGEHTLRLRGDARGVRVLVDAVGSEGEVYALRNVYQLGRLRLSLVKGAGPATLNAVIYAPASGAMGGDQLRVVIDGGAPRRLEGVVVERLTIADRRIPLPAADRAAALGFADGGGGGLVPRLVVVTLGDDLSAGLHTIELVRDRGEPLWARFFAAGEPRRPAERALKWRLAPSREDSNE